MKEAPHLLELYDSSELALTINPETLRLLEKYNEGYTNGYTWPDAWECHGQPGGPWVYTSHGCYSCNSPDGCDTQVSPRFTCAQSRAFAKQSWRENESWLKGWEAGHARKLAENRKNPLCTEQCKTS